MRSPRRRKAMSTRRHCDGAENPVPGQGLLWELAGAASLASPHLVLRIHLMRCDSNFIGS